MNPRPRALNDRLHSFALDRRAIDVVRVHAPLIKARLADIADAYYAHLATTEYRDLMRSEAIDRLKAARIEHWRLLLDGDFARIEADYADHFGPRLLDSGFPPQIFVLAAEWFLVEVGRFVDRAPEIPRTIKSELRTALTRFAFLDLALAQAAREVVLLD